MFKYVNFKDKKYLGIIGKMKCIKWQDNKMRLKSKISSDRNRK